MSHDRSAGDRESQPPRSDPDESVGPATPIRSDGDDREQSSPASPSGEYVSRAQPIDPARRQVRPAASGASGLPQQESAPADDQGSAREPESARQPDAERPPAGRALSSRRARAANARGAVDRVRRADFPVVLRGYDRTAVETYVADVAQLVAELEATQLPETVVQRALDEVGEQTSTILKRAHEAGEEITARSRSQAEDRLQRAEREAELTRKEAEDQARKLEDDIQTLWQERQRLIEDIRALADDVLALADDAIERLPAPGDERGGAERGAEGSPGEQDESGDAERPGVLGRPEGSAAPGTGSTASTPLGLAGEPPVGDATSEEDEGPDDVTVVQRPEDEDTAERPPGAAGV